MHHENRKQETRVHLWDKTIRVVSGIVVVPDVSDLVLIVVRVGLDVYASRWRRDSAGVCRPSIQRALFLLVRGAITRGSSSPCSLRLK